jgi:hypothetical protein
MDMIETDFAGVQAGTYQFYRPVEFFIWKMDQGLQNQKVSSQWLYQLNSL